VLLSEKMEEELEGSIDRVTMFVDHRAHWDITGIILIVWCHVTN